MTVTIFLSLCVVGLIIVIIFLLILYIRKDKAYELTKFSMTNKEFGIVIELNRDKKMQLLALEINSLKEQVKSLKALNEKERWQSIGMLITLFLILLIEKLKRKD